MISIELQVAQDHIESLAKVRNPLLAVEELIWNGLDADASKIEVDLEFGKLGGLERVVVRDDGTGIPRPLCDRAFGKLGGSPKLDVRRTPAGRVPHGKSGKGRFRAFGVGGTVTWISRYGANGVVKQFTIRGVRAVLRRFEIGDETDTLGDETGVEVRIEDIEQNFAALTDAQAAAAELSRRLALYLKQYPGIRILYEGRPVDPSIDEDLTANYDLTLIDNEGQPVPAELTVIEWKRPTERSLYLCDESGFTLDERAPGIQAPGFHFTAYLKSTLITRLVEENAFAVEEMHPVVESVLESAKDALRRHFRSREATRASDLVRQWQEDRIYPYETAAVDPITQAEKEVFNVCAVKVHEYLPGFEKSEAQNKRLTFRLIREALESNPRSLQTILQQLLDLPQDQQNDLAAILERTTLASIINAAKTIVARLDFLGSLDSLLFGDLKTKLLERQQLHRILVQELWLFGDQYSLGIDDQSLKSLLDVHIEILERTILAPDNQPVTDLEGKDRIVDMMLHRRYPQFLPGTFEHLVVELKRPSCTIGQKEIGQIERYAFAVADDERFDKSRTRWTFLLLGNDLDKFAENKCRVHGREFGHIHQSEEGSVNIFVRKWATIIEHAKWRYEFFRDKLELQVSSADGLQYLRSRYPEFLPTDHTSEP
ncbi:MAG: ATP-binding protein [Planctomycetia bacterium]|nr:ATP-binding protein [Planctomycetia bacterium]